MRIKLSEEVFGLIKGLSRTEKAYLKKRSFGKSGSKLETGFDIIAARKEFDDKELALKLRQHQIDPAEIYKRLLPIVLNSLSQYHSGGSAEMELNEIITASRLLVNRKLKNLGMREVKRGIDIAKKNDQFAYLIELYRIRQAAQRISYEPNSGEDELTYLESIRAAKNLETSIHHNHLYKQVLGLIQQDSISKSERSLLINDILQHPSLTIENPSDEPYKSFILRMRITCSCYYFSGKWEAAIATGNEQLRGMPAYEEGTDHNKRNMLVMLGDLATLYQLTFDRANFLKTQSILKDASEDPALFTLAKANLKLATDLLHQTDALLSGKLGYTRTIGADILEKTDPALLPPVLKKSVMTTNTLAYYYEENYSGAIQYINTEFPFSESEAFNSRIRWLELVCWFNLDDPEMFESKWRSWNRQIKKMNLGYDWEFWIMKDLKAAYGKPGQTKKEIIQALHEKLLPLSEELRTRFMGFFDFLLWTESIVKSQPVIDVIKERYLTDQSAKL